MNDRLGELTGGRSGSSSGGVAPFEVAIDINDTGDGGLGAGSRGAQGAGGFMEGFFDKVNEVKKDIDAVKKVGVCVFVCWSSVGCAVICWRWLALRLTTLGHARSISVETLMLNVPWILGGMLLCHTCRPCREDGSDATAVDNLSTCLVPRHNNPSV